MSKTIRVQVFLWGVIFIAFLARVPSLVDEYHIGRFIAVSLFSAWGLVMVLPKIKTIRLQFADALLFGFFALNLVSLSWADNFGEAILTTQKYFLLGLIYFLFRQILSEDKSFRNLIFPVVVATSFAACLIVSRQVIVQLAGDGLGGKGVYELIGFGGHKNLASSYFFVLLGLLLFWARDYGRKWWYVLLCVWMVLLILLIRTRAVYLAVAASGLAWLVFAGFANPALRKILLRAIVLGAVLIGVLSIGTIKMTGVGEQYLKYLNPSTYLSTASATERLFVWSKTWELIKDRPVYGFGAGNWKLFFPSKGVEGGYRLQEKDLVFTRVHNDFLEVCAEVGIPGLLLYLMIFALGIIGALNSLRRSKDAFKPRWLAVLLTILGFAIISFFDFPKERLEHLVALALLLALATYQGRSFGTRTSLVLEKSGRRILTGVLLIILLVNLPISYYRFLGDSASKQILIYRNSDQFEVIQKNVESGKSIWYEVDPMVIPLSWYTGITRYMENDFAAAKEPFLEAYEINPYNFNVVNNLASTLVQLQEYESAIPLYQDALKINPKFEEGMFNLAFSLFQLGKYDEAIAWVNKTTSNAQKKDVFLKQINAAKNSQ